MIKRIKTEINNNRLAIIMLTVIIVLKLLFVISLNNVDWEPDSYMHFLELKTIYTNFPQNIDLGLGVWTKPIYAYLFGIPVELLQTNSFLIVQIINLGIFFLIGYLVYKINLKLFSNKAFALLSIILVSLSLTLFKSSTSSLTEPIFTLLLVLGFFFILKNKFEISSVFIGLSVLGRIEGLFFVGIYFLYLIIKLKKIRSLITNLIILSLPALIWNFLGYLHTGYPVYIFDNGYPSTPGIYGFGQIYSFIWQLITREPVIFLLSCLSLVIFLKKFKNQKIRLELLLLFTWSFLFIAAQSFLWWKGLFGSAGLMRYFVSILPFMTILLVYLLDSSIKSKLKIRFVVLTISIVQILILSIYLLGIIPGKQEFPKVEKELIESGNWVKQNVKGDLFLGSDRPEIIYYADRDLNNSTIFYKEMLMNKKEGFYIWTKDWGESVSKIRQEEIDLIAELVHQIDNSIYIYQIKE